MFAVLLQRRSYVTKCSFWGCKVSLGIVSLNYPRVHSRVYFPETPCRNNPMQDYHGAYEIEIRYSKRHLRVFPSSMDRGCVNSTRC